jgi:hypothetical protein
MGRHYNGRWSTPNPPPPPPPPFPHEHGLEILAGGIANVSAHRLPVEIVDVAHKLDDDAALGQTIVEYPQSTAEISASPLAPITDLGETYSGEQFPIMEPYWPF